MRTELLPTDSDPALAIVVARASAVLAAGEPVALPTETVYGLAADALNPAAVAKIFEAKERPYFDPLIVHLPDCGWLDRVACIPAESRPMVDALIARFWPGPLTLVLPRQPIVPDLVTAGLETVAVRMSAHRVFGAVISAFGQPLAAPSANRFGRISPTAGTHVLAELGGRIPLIVDAGPTLHGIESTIVKVDRADLTLLRAGPVTAEDLAAVWRELCAAENRVPDESEVARFFARLGVSFPAMLHGEASVAIEAPGQLKSHYAPRTPLILLARGMHFHFDPTRTGYLAWSDLEMDGRERPPATEVLSPTGDLREAAATLFAKLRRLDEAGLDLIAAESVPEHGLGVAIMDRLKKAAARG